eukprot:NODE_28_length_33831_cov_0.361200.p12 type:complete len:178 gc:universal NODE_28_length_33831_cov_0.361200:26046-26579(+)
MEELPSLVIESLSRSFILLLATSSCNDNSRISPRSLLPPPALLPLISFSMDCNLANKPSCSECMASAFFLSKSLECVSSTTFFSFNSYSILNLAKSEDCCLKSADNLLISLSCSLTNSSLEATTRLISSKVFSNSKFKVSCSAAFALSISISFSLALSRSSNSFLILFSFAVPCFNE